MKRIRLLSVLLICFGNILIGQQAQNLGYNSEVADQKAVEAEEAEEADKIVYLLLDEEPWPLNLDEVFPLISYPTSLRESGIYGKIILRVLVNENGDYVKHIVLKSPHEELSNAIDEPIKKLRFSPGIMNKKPIKVWMTLPITFCEPRGQAN